MMNGSASRAKTSTGMPGDAHDDEHHHADRRRDQADHQVEDHHEAEVHRVDPDRAPSAASAPARARPGSRHASMMQPRSNSRTLIISSTAQGSRETDQEGPGPAPAGPPRVPGSRRRACREATISISRPVSVAHLDEDRPDVAQGGAERQQERADQEGVGRRPRPRIGGREHAREDAAQDDHGQDQDRERAPEFDQPPRAEPTPGLLRVAAAHRDPSGPRPSGRCPSGFRARSRQGTGGRPRRTAMPP